MPEAADGIDARDGGALCAGDGDKIKRMYNAENLIDTKYGDPDFWYAAADGVAMTDQYGSKKKLCDHLALLPPSPSNWD